MWSRKKLFKFSVITIVLVLLVLELVFRIVFAFEYKGYHTSVYVQGNTLQVNDTDLIFRNRPFYVDYNKNYQFNEEGMRSEAGKVLMPEKKANDLWIFIFGGSAMEGSGSNKDGEWLDITGVPDHKPEATIAGMLQVILQPKFPSKNIRVFNAANTGYSIYQSRKRYEQLAKKYQADWVISMDGENEPAVLKPGEDIKTVLQNRWNESAVFDFPLNTIIAITSHSAFANKIKQVAFNTRNSGRLKKNKKEGYPARTKWGRQPFGELKYAQPTPETQNAAAEFISELKQFDSVLTARNQKHLLYIQPHLSLRDKTKMNKTEKALFNYYTASYNDPFNNLMRKNILEGNHAFSSNIKSLAGLHKTDKQLFVDYCHFTQEANWLIAFTIAQDIVTAEKQ